MTRRRRRRSNPLIILLLIGLIGSGLYLNQVVIPQTPPLFVPTPTPTRSPESYVSEAREMFAQGNLEQSIKLYQDARLVDPANPSIFLELARVQVYMGQYEDALQTADQSLMLNNKNSQAHALRGWALYFLDDLLSAEAEIKEALSIDPNNAFAHAFYAEILADPREGFYEDAGEHSRIALSLAPELLEVRRARGIVLAQTGNNQQAVQEYLAALAINDNLADLHLALGISLRALGEFDQAVQEFNKANALRPQDPLPDTYIAITYSQVGQFSKAVQYAEQAAQEDPTNPLSYANLGTMLYLNQQREEAIEPLKIAVLGGETSDGQTVERIPLEPGRVAEYYARLGLALARVNRCSEAIPVFQLLLTGVPEDENAVYNANFGLELCQQSIDGTPTPESGEASSAP